MVSVIIPVYKVEKYLDRCVESVVNQTYKDLEIILVDDGSPDNCPTMCEEWAKKDERIKVIHKLNGGVSSARNIGLDVCSGDYVMFLDSDDTYDRETVEVCFCTIMNCQVDVVAFGIRNVSEGKVLGERRLKDGYNYDEMLNSLVLYGDSVCNKMFKKKLWNGLRFQRDIVFEDGYAMSDIYSLTSMIYSLPNVFYSYFNDNAESSLHTTKKDPKESWYRWNYEVHIVDKLKEKIEPAMLNEQRRKALEHALKAYIIDKAVHCLSKCEQHQIENFLGRDENQKMKLKLEYELYRYSYRHWDIINWIKSLEYKWKY